MAADLQSLIDRCLELAERAGGGLAGIVDPHWLVRLGRREEAAQAWETQLRTAPGDFGLWRRLAVLYYWGAKHCEVNQLSAEAVAQWEKAVDHWAVLLASDDFWRQWAVERALPCGHLEQDLDVVHRTMLTGLDGTGAKEPDRIANYTSAVASVRTGTRKALEDHFRLRGGGESVAGPYQELSARWCLELSAGCLLDRLKLMERIARWPGSPPTFLSDWMILRMNGTRPDLSVVVNMAYVVLNLSRAPANEIPSCGPAMAAALGMKGKIEEFAAGFSNLQSGSVAVSKLLDAVRPTASLLLVYLHPRLGKLLAWIDLGWYRRCEDELVAMIGTKPEGCAMKDLKKLLCLACHEHSGSALKDRDFEGAVTAMEKAELHAFDTFRECSPFDYWMDAMKGRICEGIQEELGHQRMDRKTAKDLVRRLSMVGGDVPICGTLRATLSSQEGTT